jgi:hypothetical protein
MSYSYYILNEIRGRWNEVLFYILCIPCFLPVVALYWLVFFGQHDGQDLLVEISSKYALMTWPLIWYQYIKARKDVVRAEELEAIKV